MTSVEHLFCVFLGPIILGRAAQELYLKPVCHVMTGNVCEQDRTSTDLLITTFKIRRQRRPTLVFLNHRALASIIPCRERFSWNLPFYFSKNFSWINIFSGNIEENNICECVEKLRPRCWPEKTTIWYKISLVQWLITNLNVILYLSTCHNVYT